MRNQRLFLYLCITFLISLAACQQSPNNLEVAPTFIAAETDTPSASRPDSALATTTGSASATNAAPTTTQAAPEDPTPLPTATTPAGDTAAPDATMAPSPPTVPAEGADLPGALISVHMTGSVGILLDEYPEFMHDRLVTDLTARPDDYWIERAYRQARLTKLRLNFRNFDFPEKGQLPLPPPELWEITLDPAGPYRQTINGHDLLMVDYTLNTTILTDAVSPAEAEPSLGVIGGTWQEPFIFPADPDMLLQRTGNACVNEGGFPAESYDDQNIWHLYDYTCQADDGGVAACHRTVLPRFSCTEALDIFVGGMATNLEFERLPWDPDLADAVRIGTPQPGSAPELRVVSEDLENYRLEYRFFSPGDCAYLENAIDDLGWRRLLIFDATVHNIGGSRLHVGSVNADQERNLFTYNSCHNHFHYTNYGDFFIESLSGLTAKKQAFCVQSTSRYSNNELSPLTHEYSCRFQGVQTGWVDEYIAGLDTQWIDITDLRVAEEGLDLTLGFSTNTDEFLCEGTYVTDENGQQVWESTRFTTSDGQPIQRPACDFTEGYLDNNTGRVDIVVPRTGSFVTTACAHDEAGPRRNCGFTELLVEYDPDAPICTVGDEVELNVAVVGGDAPQVLRVCEVSDALGTGVACTYRNALANIIVSNVSQTLTFPCPAVRDAEEFNSGYSLYTAPLWPDDEALEVEVQ
jgi:hypothetical protein